MITTIEFISGTVEYLKKWCAIMDKDWLEVIDVRGAIPNVKFYLKCGDGTEDEIFSGDTIIYDFETKKFRYDYFKRMVNDTQKAFNAEVEQNLLTPKQRT